MQRTLFGAGALLGFLAVGMASLAAHGFGFMGAAGHGLIAAGLQIHGWHALALLACALWLPRGGRLTAAAGLCFAAGTVLFCGAVYGAALGWWRPALAPVGGTLLLLGWLLLLGGAAGRR